MLYGRGGGMGRGGAGRKLYVILGWDSGNCFNEMECSLFRMRLAETAMFCSVFSLGRASHTLEEAIGKRVEPGVSVSKVGGGLWGSPLPS